jgi:hypothetical protein
MSVICTVLLASVIAHFELHKNTAISVYRMALHGDINRIGV